MGDASRIQVDKSGTERLLGGSVEEPSSFPRSLVGPSVARIRSADGGPAPTPDALARARASGAGILAQANVSFELAPVLYAND